MPVGSGRTYYAVMTEDEADKFLSDALRYFGAYFSGSAESLQKLHKGGQIYKITLEREE